MALGTSAPGPRGDPHLARAAALHKLRGRTAAGIAKLGRFARGVAQPLSVKPDRGPLYSVCAWASFLLPLGLAFSRLDGAERWQQDVGVVRALDLVQIGFGGALSAAASTAFSLIPVGTTLMRLGLFSSILVGFAGLAVFHLCHQVLRSPLSPGARSGLALCAAAFATFGSSWEVAGSTVSGPALAATMALAWLAQLPNTSVGSGVRRWIAWGLLLGLFVLESHVMALAMCLVLAAHCALRLELPEPRQLVSMCVAFVVAVAIGLVPSVLDVGASSFTFGLDLVLPDDERLAPSLLTELNVYLLVLAGLGVLHCARLVGGLGRTLPPLVMVALDPITREPVIHLAAVAVVGAFSSAGVLAVFELLTRAKLPYLRPLEQMVALVHCGALLLLVEGAAHESDARTLSATRQWTEEAFERLPARSLLLVSSPEAAWRLWSARVTSGIRPDVVMVPSSLLGHAAWSNELLALEPKLGPLIRDVAVMGAPSEYALTELADARPLRVEVDPHWDKTLLRHLMVDGLWFRFAPHATGRTDRLQAVSTLKHATSRLLRAASTQTGRDERTLARIERDLHSQAAVALVLGDVSATRRILHTLRRIGASSERLEPLDAAMRKEARQQPLSRLLGLDDDGTVGL